MTQYGSHLSLGNVHKGKRGPLALAPNAGQCKAPQQGYYRHKRGKDGASTHLGEGGGEQENTTVKRAHECVLEGTQQTPCLGTVKTNAYRRRPGRLNVKRPGGSLPVDRRPRHLQQPIEVVSHQKVKR